MSDSPTSASSGPDFLDRLIARHATPADTPRPGVTRVRPRLPGPFERIEAVRTGAPEPDGPQPLWPTSAPSAVPQHDTPRPAPADGARPSTERGRTVVRTERAPADPVPHAVRTAPAPEAPLLRPAAQVAPRPAPDAPRRAGGRGRPNGAAAQGAVSVPNPPGTDTAPTAVVSAALRPSAADTTAARDAVRQAAARRPTRAPEQVVQVQIGRLEVTSSAPAGQARRRTPTAAGRPGATVSLAEYLARGRE
ncbi:hypothetical protein [Streptomyces sp. NPDC002845]